MKELEYKFYVGLKSSDIPMAQVPESIKTSLLFKNLLKTTILDTRKSGRGSVLFVNDRSSFDSFINRHFSEDDIKQVTKALNILKLRDSKARRVKSDPLFLFRGFNLVIINGKDVDLKYFTEAFGVFGIINPKVKAKKVCFVENLESFLKAEKIFGKEFIYVHKYGRIGTASLSAFECDEVLVFVDYDFNGLDEYLRIKNHFPNAKLYLPDTFEELFQKFSKQIKGQQKQTRRVATSELNEVIMIRDLVAKNNYFLEQEILTHD
ncbi:MAG TPA: DUF2220 family protein [Cyclobacteriaceae bacterium]|nr:hypothetical protein [Cyclobacteriaceae bacterium]HMV07481.1 DUF2220 family protein [Cyclobacteriaceae bacterium]HMW99164.1 DUF2220 family protein [Cyclobacteriaceae bacterium]HMX48203.1 DUF2220 family protein [Cyclobacteriaceae bacterium]HMY95008.1 DUF2220 family protein [Cyclobacteriaceae bacterium]